MNHEEQLFLAIIEESDERAGGLAGILRDAGYAVEYDHVRDLEALGTALTERHPDLVVCAPGEGLPEPGAVLDLIVSRHDDIPVVALGHARVDHASPAIIPWEDAACLADLVRREMRGIRLHRHVRHLQEKLAESEKRCNAFMAGSRDPIAYIYEDVHIEANRSYLEMFGFHGADDIEGTPVLDVIDAADHDRFRSFLEEHLASGGTPAMLEARGSRPGGETFDAAIEVMSASVGGDPCTQLTIRNRNDIEFEKKIDAMGRQDMLTGLSNRQHFMRVLEEDIHGGSGDDRLHAIAYLLLDNFRSIREEVGIMGSDTVVNDIGRLLAEACSDDDTVARFGDCVFTILHRDGDEEATLRYAESIREKIYEYVAEIEGRAVTTTCSIGICLMNKHTDSAQDAILRADLACEVARSSGGNQIHIHSTAVDEKMDGGHEAEWDEVIDNTIRQERFYLVYQPIVSLNGAAGERYEVLLRILDEEGHVILPGQFLSIAEKTGKGGEIDRWVISNAFRKLMQRRSSGAETELFIKLSGPSLQDPELPQWIAGKLEEYRLAGDSVCFEIPEAFAIKDLKSTLQFVKAMQQRHIKVAIEHFGCANQPMLIKHLPVNLLKVDGSLINNLASSHENQEKAQLILELARSANLPCIAERVDQAGDLAKLWELGFDYIQGNFVQEPSKEMEHDFSGELA